MDEKLLNMAIWQYKAWNENKPDWKNRRIEKGQAKILSQMTDEEFKEYKKRTYKLGV